MLVLQRAHGESIYIDLSKLTHADLDEIQKSGTGRIEVQLVRIRTSNYARIGIDCPSVIPVHRSEVQDAIDEHHRQIALGKVT